MSISCPAWCYRQEESCGDHIPDLEGREWPAVAGTPWPADNLPKLTAYPSWGEVDNTAPSVTLFTESNADGQSLDLTPDEAAALADRLMHAARAAREEADG
jgi:hypothetical protein